MEKIVVFGVGRFYSANREELYRENRQMEIIALLDNNPALWGTVIDGIEISPPEKVKKIPYDRVIIMVIKSREVKEQLVRYGVPKEKITDGYCFMAYLKRGMVRYYCRDCVPNKSRKEILFIAAPLSYDGSTMAAVYAVQCLQHKGYHVLLAAQKGNETLIEELVKSGLQIAICPSIPYIFPEELLWIHAFDAVVVNTAIMMISACAISKVKPVFWWVHEVSDRFGMFSSTEERFSYYSAERDFSRINIAAVSAVARDNFNDYYPDSVKNILPYGLPDEKKIEPGITKETDKMIFAVIGVICERKAQKLILDAYNLLDSQERDKTELWLIGRYSEDAYSLDVLKQAQTLAEVKICGEMTRKEIRSAYSQIDVVVCPSLEETMSIVVTEGMMFGKVCVTSDTTGIADYIHNGENGFIFESENQIDLSQKLSDIINRRYDLGQIGENARKTYVENFTMEEFGNRLERIIEEL